MFHRQNIMCTNMLKYGNRGSDTPEVAHFVISLLVWRTYRIFRKFKLCMLEHVGLSFIINRGLEM